MSKGSARYKDRQQATDELMHIRWELAFNKKLTAEEREDLTSKILSLEAQDKAGELSG